jgi:hypothetical protein
MNSQEIYKLASEITEQEVKNVIAGWENTNETKKLRLYNSLVRLGDSKQLACATVMLKEPVSKEVETDYRFAYEN